MKKSLTLVSCLAVAVALGGCDETKEALGYSKTAPDEFAVYQRAPLSLPPSYDLRPPEPGKTRPQEGSTRDQAKDALLQQAEKTRTVEAEGRSRGEHALLRRAGALDVDPSIRAQVDRETSIYAAESKGFTDKLMFWDAPGEYGSAVDAAKESQRIRENQALGKPITEGETPVIERKRRALFEGVFN